MARLVTCFAIFHRPGNWSNEGNGEVCQMQSVNITELTQNRGEEGTRQTKIKKYKKNVGRR